VLYKNRVYCANGQDPDHGEGVGVLTCLDATKTGDITETGKVWVFDKINRSISTCSIKDDLLFIADFSGYVYCLDAETGKPYWIHNSGAHIWGSTLLVDGKVYFGNEDGDSVVLAANKEGGDVVEGQKQGKVLGKVNVGQAIYGTPIVANGTMYIATQSHLFAIHQK
jgi:outer membrane protein assembly factor BamB